MFQKGNKYGKGRPPGSENKTTTALRNKMLELVNSNWKQLQKDFTSLEPKERLSMFVSMAKYLLPTLKTIEINDSENVTSKITIDEVNDLNRYIEQNVN